MCCCEERYAECRTYVMDMLADRGAAAVDEVARALVAEPDSVQAGDLAEVLVDIADDADLDTGLTVSKA